MVKIRSIFFRNKSGIYDFGDKESDELSAKTAAVQVITKQTFQKSSDVIDVNLFVGRDFLSRQLVCDNDWHWPRLSRDNNTTSSSRRC
jgi:hypothetical protein